MGTDSKVVQGLRSRGRTSSFRLNGINRLSLPFVIGADMYFSYYYIPSKDNPADDGTRYRELRTNTACTPVIEQA